MQTLLNQIASTSEILAAEIEEWNDDVIDESLEFDDVHDSSSESDGEAAALVKVSHTNALDDVNELIEWCTQNEEIGSQFALPSIGYCDNSHNNKNKTKINYRFFQIKPDSLDMYFITHNFNK